MGVQSLQAQVRVWSAPDDHDARQQVELTLAGMLWRGIAEREDQVWPAAARGSCVVITNLAPPVSCVFTAPYPDRPDLTQLRWANMTPHPPRWHPAPGLVP